MNPMAFGDFLLHPILSGVVFHESDAFLVTFSHIRYSLGECFRHPTLSGLVFDTPDNRIISKLDSKQAAANILSRSAATFGSNHLDIVLARGVFLTFRHSAGCHSWCAVYFLPYSCLAPAGTATASTMDLTELGGCLSGSEDDARTKVSAWDDDAGSVSDSPELTCVGCRTTSKSECPVEVRKRGLSTASAEPAAKKRSSASQAGAPVRAMWGKYTARKVKTQSGRKVKVRRRCGVWCRICMNILKKVVKRKKYVKIAKAGMKKNDKHAAVNKIKEEIEDGTLAERWKRAHGESVHQLAGGKSRVYSKGAFVQKTNKHKVALAQRGKFYCLSKYKDDFGDPAITKAKVVKRIWKGKKIRGVVVVSETDAGVFEHTCKSSAGTEKNRTKFAGADALVEEDLDDAESDALSGMSEEISYPWPSGAHKFSHECAGGLGTNSGVSGGNGGHKWPSPTRSR